MKGVDVSVFNDTVDWQAVKRAGFDFAICRAGYGKSGVDDSFIRNVKEAHDAGLICGAYFYSYALNTVDAYQEAQHCKKIICDSGVLLELPIFFDMEDADGYKKIHGFNFNRRNITDICKVFLAKCQPLNCGVYASYSWLEKFIDWKSLNCPIWNAQWGEHDFLKGFMWQFTDSANIGGNIFDGNIIY